MGLLVNGGWTDQWYDTKSSGGRFVRKDQTVCRPCDHVDRTMIFRKL